MIYCEYCKKRITGQYITDSWGLHFHQSCLAKCHICGSCNRNIFGPMLSEAILLKDNRYICHQCIREGLILKESQMMKCVKAVYYFFNQADIILPINNIRYKLVDANVLQKKVTGSVTKYSKNSNNSYEISMLEGLNKTIFCAVLAHELMHVHIYEKELILNSLETEGLCELVSYFTYKRINNSIAKHQINVMDLNPDPIYGQGYRLMKEKVKPFSSIQGYLKSHFINK